jgi:hypothetical protein
VWRRQCGKEWRSVVVWYKSNDREPTQEVARQFVEYESDVAGCPLITQSKARKLT